ADGISLLATNTISQGDTREVGLDQLLEHGWRIVRASKSRKWPGDANLEIAQVWLRRDWRGTCTLINASAAATAVASITSMLEEGDIGGNSQLARLRSSQSYCFIGSALNTEAFMLSPLEAAAMIE